MCSDFSRTLLNSLLSLVYIVMAPRGCKPRSSSLGSLRVSKVVIAVAEFYEEFVPEEDKATMSALEAEVRLVREFKDDGEVEYQVGGLIPDLGCTRTRNSKFFRTLELYWHTKTMVALGMLPKDEDFRQLKRRMETLEAQNAYLMEVVTWIAHRHGGSFHPPVVPQPWVELSAIVARKDVSGPFL
jgi:hypothetical protein